VRFSVQLSRTDVETLRRLCREHGKTQREMLGFGIQAADSLLAGRLQVVKPRLVAERLKVGVEQVPTPSTNIRSSALKALEPILEQPQQDSPPVEDAGVGEPWWPSNFRQLLAEE